MNILKYLNLPLGLLDNRKMAALTTGEAFSSRALNAAGNVLQGTLKDGLQNGFLNIGSNALSNLKSMKPSPAGAVGMAADMVSSFLPEKTEYAGEKGNITKTMDGVYDKISDGLMSVPGFGMAAGAIMKGAKVLGLGVNAIGGGTDGMTTTDAILGSSFFNLTPVGMINGFGGSKSDTFVKDTNTFNKIGTSYAGTDALANNASLKSNKKYGLFSLGAKNKANNIMNNARLQQSTMRMISDTSDMNTEVLSNQASLMNNASTFEQSGGYDMNTVEAAKLGAKLTLSNLLHARYIINHPIDLLKEMVPQHKEGNKINLKEIALPKNVSRAIRLAKTGIKFTEPKIEYDFNGGELTDDMIKSLGGGDVITSKNILNNNSENKLYDVLPDKEVTLNNAEITNVPKWLTYDSKTKHYTTGKYHNEKDWKDYIKPLEKLDKAWLRKHKLNRWEDDEGLIIYIPDEEWSQEVDKGWMGSPYGNVSSKELYLLGIIHPSKEYDFNGKELYVDDEGNAYTLKNGGQMNLIPEGALHAHKHHMENDEEITKKGIPVVVEEEGGHLDLLAEIERNEIILNKELTDLLEKLYKLYYKEETTSKEKEDLAIEAGKLLSAEIVENTDDRTGLMETI